MANKTITEKNEHKEKIRQFREILKGYGYFNNRGQFISSVESLYRLFNKV